MFDRMQQKQQQMANRLRREANAARPEFSANLHAQIMAAVRAEPRNCQPVKNNANRWAWSLASAALVFFVVSLTFWGLSGKGSEGPTTASVESADTDDASPLQDLVSVPPELSPVDETSAVVTDEVFSHDAMSGIFSAAVDRVESLQDVETLVESDLIGEQLAMLDHDARIFAGWLIDPLTETLSN